MLPRTLRLRPGCRLFKQRPLIIRAWAPSSLRFQSTESAKNGVPDHASSKQGVPIGKLDLPPKLMIGFTCKKCSTRSSHTMSKQAFETGLVLIQCPGCKNRHLIADNLKVFSEGNFNLRQHLEKHGELISDDPSKLPIESKKPESDQAIEVANEKRDL